MMQFPHCRSSLSSVDACLHCGAATFCSTQAEFHHVSSFLRAAFEWDTLGVIYIYIYISLPKKTPWCSPSKDARMNLLKGRAWKLLNEFMRWAVRSPRVHQHRSPGITILGQIPKVGPGHAGPLLKRPSAKVIHSHDPSCQHWSSWELLLTSVLISK